VSAYDTKDKATAYEDTGTALGRRALAAEALDLAVRVDLVVLQDRHLDLLALVLDLLGGLRAPLVSTGQASRGNRRCKSSSCASWRLRGGEAPGGG
jgi:hypothetical protein